MKQFKIFVDFEKEEQYLNDMAKKGHILKKYTAFGFYHFLEGSKEDLKYRVDYRTFKKKNDFEDYKAMFEDFGWQHIYGTINGGNQYFLPKDDSADDNIFSSNESSVERYKKLYEICSMSVLLGVIYFIVVLMACDLKISELGFLTPGLWEKTGIEFVNAVLFELPFVLLRVVPVLFLAVMGIAYGVWAVKARNLYKKKIQEQEKQ